MADVLIQVGRLSMTWSTANTCSAPPLPRTRKRSSKATCRAKRAIAKQNHLFRLNYVSGQDVAKVFFEAGFTCVLAGLRAKS